MMAMVYSVQGAFWPLLAVHLKDLDIASHHRGMIFATMAIGSFAMPLGFGQLVDRFMAAQKLLALIFLIATGFLVAFAMGVSRDPVVLFFLFLIFWLITAPAYSLTNTIALRHLPRPYEQFPRVRLWGTVGWMAVGWLVSTIMAVTGSVRVGEGAFEAFWIAAVLAILFSAYCLTLPDTPPLVKAGDEKPPEDVHRGQCHGQNAHGLAERGFCQRSRQHGSHDHDRGDGVGDGHQGRVQGRGHRPDDVVAHVDGQHEDDQIDDGVGDFHGGFLRRWV